MGLLNSASYNSVSRGYDYAKDKQVLAVEKVSESVYDGLVKGTRAEPYKVHIDIEHIRNSRCTCPFTEGNRKICKHMIALFFTVSPDEMRIYERDVREAEELAEFVRIETERKLYMYINKLKKQDLRDHLIDLLERGPEWQYDNFIRDFVEMPEDYEDYALRSFEEGWEPEEEPDELL